jgi:hypothetical protein
MFRTLRRLMRAQEPKAAFHLAVAYLIWSIAPHFHQLYHTHAPGGAAPAALSQDQVRMANRVLNELGPAGLTEAKDDGAGTEEHVRLVYPSEPTVADGAEGIRHGHSWEDANLAGAAGLPDFHSLRPGPLPYPRPRYLPPGLRPTGAAPARGPPARPIA